MTQVLISRESSDVGKPGRVYVTGPHFGTGHGPPSYRGAVFSSTLDRAQASAFRRSEAEAILARSVWAGAVIEEAENHASYTCKVCTSRFTMPAGEHADLCESCYEKVTA